MHVIYEPKGRAGEYALLAANLYTGCPHGCGYCWVPQVLHRDREEFLKTEPRKDVLKQLEKDAAHHLVACTPRRVLLCFACDPYPPLAKERGITRQAIEILRRHSVPFQVLTKGGMLAARDFDLYRPYDMFGSTMTFTVPDDSEKWEPGAASPANRIAAIGLAKSKGIRTWASLEPVVDPAQTLDLIRLLHNDVDHFKIGILNYAKPPAPIDWREFGRRAIELCEFHRVSYYIKHDLAVHLGGVDFENTDTRTVI